MVARVISGGQTGADQAGLFAARACGLATGGWAPAGWRTSAGVAHWLAEFGLREHASHEYPPRTGCNVKDADATIILGDASSQGCVLTLKYIRYFKRPYLVVARPFAVADAQRIADWLRATRAVTLNVAGNRESSFPGIGQDVYDLLTRAFWLALSGGKAPVTHCP